MGILVKISLNFDIFLPNGQIHDSKHSIISIFCAPSTSLIKSHCPFVQTWIPHRFYSILEVKFFTKYALLTQQTFGSFLNSTNIFHSRTFPLTFHSNPGNLTVIRPFLGTYYIPGSLTNIPSKP